MTASPRRARLGLHQKRARLVAFAAIALTGCRAVLGIEELTSDQDASLPSEDAAANDVANDTTLATGGDAANDATTIDAPNDTNPPPHDAPTTNACTDAGTMCPACCRQDNDNAVRKAQEYAIEAGCLCGSNTCADACAGTVCPPTSPSMVPGQCAMCVDPIISPPPPGQNPQCPSALTRCNGDPNCSPYLTCLGGCPHP